MAITFPITLPATPGFSTARLTPITVVAASRSPFTLEKQTQVHQGQRWDAELALPTMTRAEAEPWLAAITSLNGKEGSFLFGDPTGATPRGSAKDTPGTPLVKGAGQTGADINFDGAPASATGYLLAGDWVQLGTAGSSRLYKVLQDVNTSGGSPAGTFTLTLWPKVTSAPADNAALVVSGAEGVFSLPGNANPWDVDESLEGGAYTLAFTAEGAI